MEKFTIYADDHIYHITYLCPAKPTQKSSTPDGKTQRKTPVDARAMMISRIE